MNRWTSLGALLFGVLFALFALGPSHLTESGTWRWAAAAFLFGTYSAMVIFATSGKKRSISLPTQTVRGVLFACAIAALFGAAREGYTLASVSGVVLGFTADMWAKHIQLP